MMLYPIRKVIFHRLIPGALIITFLSFCAYYSFPYLVESKSILVSKDYPSSKMASVHMDLPVKKPKNKTNDNHTHHNKSRISKINKIITVLYFLKAK